MRLVLRECHRRDAVVQQGTSGVGPHAVVEVRLLQVASGGSQRQLRAFQEAEIGLETDLSARLT